MHKIILFTKTDILSRQVFTMRRGSSFPHYRLLIVSLALLNVVLLIAAIVIGIYCSKVFETNIQKAQHATDVPLVLELNYLSKNHNGVIKEREEAKRALQKEISIHKTVKLQLLQQKSLNEDLEKLTERLLSENTILKSNISVLEQSCGDCLPGWTVLNSTCYFFSHPESNPKATWPMSREDCINRGADLLVIDNEEKQRLVSSNLPSRHSGGVWWADGFWIGLTDIDVEGTWVWINNVTEVKPIRYWIDGEPNNHGPEGENCGAVASLDDSIKTWYDGKCNQHKFNWICEMPK